MSGGHFDYGQYRIQQICDDIDELIIKNNSTDVDKWGDPVGYGFSEGVIKQFETGLRLLKLAYVYAQRIDWLVSGDDGEEEFFTRLEHDLRKVINE